MIIEGGCSICCSALLRKGYRNVRWPKHTIADVRTTGDRAGLAQSAVGNCMGTKAGKITSAFRNTACQPRAVPKLWNCSCPECGTARPVRPGRLV